MSHVGDFPKGRVKYRVADFELDEGPMCIRKDGAGSEFELNILID